MHVGWSVSVDAGASLILFAKSHHGDFEVTVVCSDAILSVHATKRGYKHKS